MPEKVENTLVCLKLRFAQCSEGLKKAWGFNGGDILRVGEPSYRVLGCVEKTLSRYSLWFWPMEGGGMKKWRERGEEQVALYCFSVVIFILCWTFTCRCAVTPGKRGERDHCSKCELEITNRMLSATPRLPDCNLYIVALQKESQGFSIRH